MKDFSEITLCEFKNEVLDCYVSAKLKEGKLTISGQDLSKTAEDVFGSSEYEYFYALNNEDTTLLASLLAEGIFSWRCKITFLVWMAASFFASFVTSMD